MNETFISRLFVSSCKLLCDCFKYLLKRNDFQQHQMSKTNFEVHMKHLKVLVKWNLWWNLNCSCTISLNFKKQFSRLSMGNCFWCYASFSRYNNDYNILNVILVQGFGPLETEIARFAIGFQLNLQAFCLFSIFVF